MNGEAGVGAPARRARRGGRPAGGEVAPLGAARIPLFAARGAGPVLRCGGAFTGALRTGRGAGFPGALRRQLPEAGAEAFRRLGNPVSRRRVSGDRSGDGEGIR